MISTLKTFGLALFLTLASTFVLQAQTPAPMWKVDKAHTSVNFSINHFFSTVTGKFTNFDGVFQLDPANLAGSKAQFTIQVSSIDTDNEKRDQHLQSPDFFNSQKFPTIRFESTKMEQKSDKLFVVYGNLTMKNTTKKIALPITVKGQMEHPMMKGTIILGLSTQLKLNRNDYGVGTGDWAATMVVGDEVAIDIHMELNQMKK